MNTIARLSPEAELKRESIIEAGCKEVLASLLGAINSEIVMLKIHAKSLESIVGKVGNLDAMSDRMVAIHAWDKVHAEVMGSFQCIGYSGVVGRLDPECEFDHEQLQSDLRAKVTSEVARLL